MARKDSEKETDRPHYYSQFWLDVAAGRRIIGGPKPEDGEAIEQEPVEPVAPRRVGRTTNHNDHVNGIDGHHESATGIHPVAEPEVTGEDQSKEDEAGPFDAASSADDIDAHDMDIEDADIPDMDLSAVDEEEDDDLFEDEEDEEDEDDEEDEEQEDWGRGRKKAKPTRATKQPAKRPKRERRTY